MKSLTTYVYLTEDGRFYERDYPFGEAPRRITTPDGKIARRYFGSSNTIIPEYMRAGSDQELEHFDKRHWQGKKYF